MDKQNRRYYARIYGIVQGIGYRPFIYKIAKELNLRGWVSNIDSSVAIDIEGPSEKVEQFLIRVIKKPPKLAKIDKVEIIEKDFKEYKEFKIKKSIQRKSKLKFIIPDLATCNECVEDIFDTKSNRYRYAFTNCTNCGPRYSIIKSFPYDRENTTMKAFKMCPSCNEEYISQDSRRFHAQPNCCSKCGPRLILIDNRGNKISCVDEIKETANLLKEGKIIAIKGIGGFHLVCNAYDEKAISNIRLRKKRPHKPLAIMVKNIKKAKEHCIINIKEEELLLSTRKPIVLLNKREDSKLPQNIAPKVNKYGVMLPYTPLHYLLFNEGLDTLIMTSGNISGCPIEYENNSAISKLKDIANYFLLNDRDINTPIDDSVVKVIKNNEVLIRPGRGYAPISLNKNVQNKILACGADMKSTFALSSDGIVYGSQYMGNLKELDSFREYEKAIGNLEQLYDYNPQVIAADMHPGYLSSIYSEKKDEIKYKVQHHHAHMASCMLEKNIYERVIGVIYDGMGLGLDNNIWGGEFFIGNRESFQRRGSYRYTSIQGGDSAQENIWKIGLSYLDLIRHSRLKKQAINRMKTMVKDDIEITCKALKYNINCYKTSSVGRLFDGIASILGVIQNISYEAQGAIELEAIAAEGNIESYTYSISEDKLLIVNIETIIQEIISDIEKGTSRSIISAKFHNTIINITIEIVCKLRDEYGINKAILSGGVFENQYLLINIIDKLQGKDFEVFFNNLIPTNDSGVSFGQVAVVNEILKKGV
ncbi:carbamoyltransferase HypF [Clostridium homopropionicum DSM 5847]|uniref:Carbamoyltransferase n=1 Tax=Clostridium homopropionicum DSM 5847 TaxID=1121318 RepID=A0A0L6Z5A7_9CLOT|nr:carbamoyltransferase HypF [Clostridium homopropionicum]KOA18141.1 carbamoyltransferase HypF [Clostridium homopropionicum DSM 5847]SFG96683.1 Hydrogenase maturation protein, carbamoyltransferase HypF [Clostridium homopropionicum]